ncbi:MAG: GAF domain-containing protein [Anaerolineae bacterium]|nr:GAF domain-containing protein [Anaerolineae bacterium]
MTIAFLVLGVAVLLVAGGLQLFFSIRAQQESVAREQQFIAQDAANTVVNFVQEKFSLLESAAKLSDPRLTSQEEQARHLRSLLGLDPAFRHLTLLDVQGQEIAESSRLAQTTSGRLLDQAGADALTQVQQGKRYVGPVYVDDATSEPMVIMAIPVIDVFGDFQGTLMAEVNLKFMWDLVDRLEVGEGGLVYVVDRYGNLIAFGDVARVLRGENVSQLNEVSEFVSSSAPVDETGASISTGIDGTRVVATYVPLGTPDWAVVIELPVAEAYRGVIQSAVISAGVILVMATLAGLLGIYMARRLSVPLHTLTETASRVAEGEMELQAAMAGPSEVADLARAFNSMTAQLRGLIGSLEERVAARTLELERHSTYLEASAEVASAASSILDVEQLIKQVVELIRQRFSLYYVGLFLVDEIGEWAVLQAGTGEAGRVMLARSHRIKIGEGMIGWCVANARSRIALDVGEDAVRLATSELPETRSEAALPLRVRGRVIGALTVQSSLPAAFDEETVSVFQIMADQVAIALENARLLAESRAALDAAGRAYGELSREAWASLLQARPDMGYRSGEGGAVRTEGAWRPEMEQALQKEAVVQGDGDGEKAALAVPIKVRGQVIGVLGTSRPAEAGEWTSEELALLEVLTTQLGEALESARLYRDTQRRAAHEQLMGHIVDRMRRTVDMDALMQTTIQEVASALGASSAFVQLGIGAGAAGENGGDGETDAREEQTG